MIGLGSDKKKENQNKKETYDEGATHLLVDQELDKSDCILIVCRICHVSERSHLFYHHILDHQDGNDVALTPFI